MKAIFQKVDVPSESSITAFVFQKENFDVPWHFHPEFELIYIKSSSGIRYVGQHVEDYHPGELLLLGSNLPHCWKNTEISPEGAQSLVVQWRPGLIGELPELANIRHLLSRSIGGIKFSREVASKSLPVLEEMLGAPSLNVYILLLKILAVLAESKSAEILNSNSYKFDLSIETSERLERIQQYVQQHYSHKISLAQVATQISMTEQSFSRFFSKTMNRPFFQFLNEYRVNMASKLLVDTDKQVAEIAYACGYETLPFFFKQFKRFKGYSPLAFRKLFSGVV